MPYVCRNCRWTGTRELEAQTHHQAWPLHLVVLVVSSEEDPTQTVEDEVFGDRPGLTVGLAGMQNVNQEDTDERQGNG